MLQQKKPDDFVLATGKQYSVREFVELAFKELNINIDWEGKGKNEVGRDSTSGKKIIAIHPKYYRLTEVDTLLGDATKAKKLLGWEAKTSLKELVKKMVHSDWKKIKNRDYK